MLGTGALDEQMVGGGGQKEGQSQRMGNGGTGEGRRNPTVTLGNQGGLSGAFCLLAFTVKQDAFLGDLPPSLTPSASAI